MAFSRIFGAVAVILVVAWPSHSFATSLKDFFDSTSPRERSVAVVMAITTQAYRYAADGDQEAASCVLTKFRVSQQGSQGTFVSRPMQKLMSKMIENKNSIDQQVEGYIIKYIDAYCPNR